MNQTYSTCRQLSELAELGHNENRKHPPRTYELYELFAAIAAVCHLLSLDVSLPPGSVCVDRSSGAYHTSSLGSLVDRSCR